MGSAEDLNESDEQILDELKSGARTKGALVDATGLHRNTVGHRLDVLKASDIIEEIHSSTALYELVDDPRESDAETAREAAAGLAAGEQDVDPGRVLDALRAATRAAAEIPDDVPGRGSLEDAIAILEEELGED